MTRKRIKQKITKVTRLPGNAVVMSLMAVILLCGAPVLIASIDSKDSTHDLIVERDISSYFADATFSGYWGEKPEGVTVSYDGLVDGNSVIITADYDEYAGVFRICDLDISLLTDLSKLELISSEILRMGTSSSIKLDDGSYLPFSKSEDGVLTFSPSSVDLIKINNSETFDITLWSLDPTSMIELEFTPYYQYTIPYGEIIIGATGVLLMVCALLATPWFGLSGYTGRRITRRR